jgi:hypothetical protein
MPKMRVVFWPSSTSFLFNLPFFLIVNLDQQLVGHKYIYPSKVVPIIFTRIPMIWSITYTSKMSIGFCLVVIAILNAPKLSASFQNNFALHLHIIFFT